MMDMDRNTQAALRLLAELQHLAEVAPAPATAARVTIRSHTGEYLGEVAVPVRAADEVANAINVVAGYAVAMPADYLAGRGAPAPVVAIDPELEAELEEHCIGLDTDYLVSMAVRDPREAVAAFDEVTGYGEES